MEIIITALLLLVAVLLVFGRPIRIEVFHRHDYPTEVFAPVNLPEAKQAAYIETDQDNEKLNQKDRQTPVTDMTDVLRALNQVMGVVDDD